MDMVRVVTLSCVVAFIASPAAPGGPATERITDNLTFLRGPVNGALLEHDSRILAVYGDPRESPAAADTVLFTHHRRDVAWAGRRLLVRGAKAVVPEAEIGHFTKVSAFWEEFTTKRFHDYAQQSTKIITRPLPVSQAVKGGETFTWEGIPIRVLDTPGYTRGSVTYLVESGGKTIAFTGDLIYGDGKLLDLYSLQDAIPEARIGGYHGYAARLGDVIASLRKVAGEKPDVIVPARGPLIKDPTAAIETLVDRIKRFYTNYLSIDALRWYFKDDHILAKARRVLGQDAKVQWMPMAETKELPPWIVPIANTRLILSADRTGFLIDCGSQGIIAQLEKMRAEGKLTSIEHIFITHYHDDHTDQVSRFVELFGATVHASRENWDILENPGAYRLPAMTANPIHISGRASSGARWRWKEFELTLYYFPGQTIHHDGLLVKKDGGEEFFFIGDSFTPSGIDDYCLLNRNFLHPGTGYFFCLDLVKRSAPDALLINQHVGPPFRFSREQIDRMTETLKRRVGLLRPLLPWDDPNWGLDEGWARFHTYACRVRKGETATLRLKILNHSPHERIFRVRLRLPEGWRLEGLVPHPLRIPARQEAALQVRIRVPKDSPAGLRILTADLLWDQWELREWTEALITVEG